MNYLLRLPLSIVLFGASFVATAQRPTSILPDNVILCQTNTGCFSKTVFGITYKVIRIPRFTVMASISEESGYTRADISILNNSGLPLDLTPDDFRIEVLTPKAKILSYVSPADLKNVAPPPALPTPLAETPQVPVSASPRMLVASNSQDVDIDMLYAETKRKEVLHQEYEKALAQQHLTATSVAPNEMASGRVYFTAEKHTKTINLVIPVAGLVFEFPYQITH